MKILFVRTYYPNQISYGSDLRSARLLDFLCSKGQVDFLTLKKLSPYIDQKILPNKLNYSYCLDRQNQDPRPKMAAGLLCLLPWQVTEHYHPLTQKRIRHLLEENNYDLIFIFKLQPTLYFLNLPSKWHKKIVVDFDDILSKLYFHYPRTHVRSQASGYLLKRYERKVLSKFKRIFLCSEQEISAVFPKYREKIGIIPNIFETNGRIHFSPPSSSHQLLFVGTLDYFPNIEGLRWFCHRIWPVLKKNNSNLSLTIVGKTTSPASRSLQKEFGNPEDVEIITNVPDVSSYYQDSFATIVPLLNGSGTRIKILESAAHGRPVITTAKGMEGLNFKDKKNIFVFHDAPSFTQAYKNLLETQRYAEITREAFTVVKADYSPAAFLSGMEKNWNELFKN